jgi:hypothetical protein
VSQSRPRPGETLLPAAADMAGISYRTIDYWVRQGYVQVRVDRPDTSSWAADYPNAPGSGHSRYLCPSELYLLLQMARLVRAGTTPAVAARLTRQLDPSSALTQTVTLGPGLALVIRPEQP